MTKLFPLIILFFAVTAFAQTSDPAVPTYSINEKLIGLSNLTGLSDCQVRSVLGKVKKIERNRDSVSVTVKVDKKTRETAVIPLERVAADDRKTLLRHLITKNNTVRISGYACTEEGPFSAFSVDRVY